MDREIETFSPRGGEKEERVPSILCVGDNGRKVLSVDGCAGIGGVILNTFSQFPSLTTHPSRITMVVILTSALVLS